MENLIDAFEDNVSKGYDIPNSFIRATAYWVLSTTLGEHIQILGAPMKYRRPNLFIILSSPPGIARRSTVLSLGKDVVHSVLLKIFNEERLAEGIFAEDFTAEGLGDAIEEELNHRKEGGLNSQTFALTYEEFGLTLLRTTKRDSYLKGMLSLLSKLYYGEKHKQLLSSRSGKKGIRLVPEGLYVTMLATMQEPKTYRRELKLALDQGFLRRALLVYVSQEDIKLKDYKPPIYQERDGIRHLLVNKYSDFIYGRAEEIVGAGKVIALLDSYVIDRVNSFARELHERSLKGGRESYYNETAWEFLVKLAVLEGVADLKNSINKNTEAGTIFLVKQKHFERAKMFFDEIVPNLRRAIEEITTNIVEMPVRTYSIYERINNVVDRHGGKIAWSLLTQSIKTSPNDLRKAVADLVENGEVFVTEEVSPGPKGKRMIIWRDEGMAQRYLKERTRREGGIVSKRARLLTSEEIRGKFR